MKQCSLCKKIKALSEFSPNKVTKDGKASQCKICRRGVSQRYRKTHVVEVSKQQELYHIQDVIKRPWRKHYKKAKERCEDPKNNRFNVYGARGIKFLMTLEDFKFLWFRDKAYELKQPSIDRKDNDGNYILNNCRFIEKVRNVRHDKTKIHSC